MDYESNEFLIDGSESFTYDQLSYHDKIKVKALQGLDQLAASLNAISNVKAIEFQINHLNSMTSGFTEQLEAKDAQIEHLTEQLLNIEETQTEQLEAIQNSQAASKALLEAQITELQASNAALAENFNKLKAVLTSIDSLTDEVID